MNLCDCPAWPVNVWYRQGEVVTHRVVNPAADPGVDADAWLASGCDAWVIMCPMCTRMYAAMLPAGVLPPGGGPSEQGGGGSPPGGWGG